MTPPKLNLKPEEIRAAFGDAADAERFPPILNVPLAARLLGDMSPSTLYEWIAKGRLDGTFRKRGKHHLFWRDRLIARIFNDPEWRSSL